MKIPYIEIKKIKIGEHDVAVPHGLSDLLNSAGVWTAKPKESSRSTNEYHRRVELRDGRLFTILTKCSKATQENEKITA